MFLYKLILLYSSLILYGASMPVEETEDFLDSNDSVEVESEDSKGTIKFPHYNPGSWYTWELYAPVTEDQKFTFVFNVSLMDIETDNVMHVPGMHVMMKRSWHVSEDCPDFLMIQDRKYCGTITQQDAPLIIKVPNVYDIMRIDFRSDSDIQGRGFLASYEWKPQHESHV